MPDPGDREDALIEATAAAVFRRLRVPSLMPGTVVAYDAADETDVLLDDDGEDGTDEDDAVQCESWVGPLLPEERVMVLLYPPAGAAVVARLDQDWHDVSFENSWVNFGGSETDVAYRKDASGVVHLRGMMKNGTIGLTAFTLPPLFRPAANESFITYSTAAAARLEILPDGSVVPGPTAPTGGATSFSLGGVTFAAGG